MTLGFTFCVMNRWNLFFPEEEISLEEFLLRAVAEDCGLQKQIDRLIVRHARKCLEYGALLVTGSVDHKVVSLLVFLLCPLHGFNTYGLFLSRRVTRMVVLFFSAVLWICINDFIIIHTLTIQSPNRQWWEPQHKETFSKTKSKSAVLVKLFIMRLGLNQLKWLLLISRTTRNTWRWKFFENYRYKPNLNSLWQSATAFIVQIHIAGGKYSSPIINNLQITGVPLYFWNSG